MLVLLGWGKYITEEVNSQDLISDRARIKCSLWASTVWALSLPVHKEDADRLSSCLPASGGQSCLDLTLELHCSRARVYYWCVSKIHWQNFKPSTDVQDLWAEILTWGPEICIQQAPSVILEVLCKTVQIDLSRGLWALVTLAMQGTAHITNASQLLAPLLVSMRNCSNKHSWIHAGTSC